MKNSQKDLMFIKKALILAQKAYDTGEVPVGALVVSAEGKILGKGYNQAFKKKSQNMHAEMLALQKATVKMGDWRLEGCTLYVTLEPCLMCLGFALLSRVERIVYSAESPLFGACLDKSILPDVYNKHTKEIISGIEAEASQELLKLFFKSKRPIK